MPLRLNFFHMLSAVQKKHGLSDLDPTARAILDLIVERELAGLTTNASEIIAQSTVSQATVYRKIAERKANGSIIEDYRAYQLCYVASDKIKMLSEDLQNLLAEANQDLRVESV